tara:strand:+ start:874 stop:1209 length:336 start_codon:yes stop_codon:yes gene_type:complete
MNPRNTRFNLIRDYWKLYHIIQDIADYLRSRHQNTAGLYKLVSELVWEFNKIKEGNLDDYKIPEANPSCPECKGEGVVLYNYTGKAKRKDDDEYLNPEVREEPCPKCEDQK